MLVVVLEKPHNKATGLLSHYMLEIRRNVFVGNINSRIRNILKSKMNQYGQSSLFIYENGNAQGFEIETTGGYSVKKYLNMIVGVSYE